ncbi:MAG: sel1 repeat family protein [Alphaproteobacteria bacterium]|jgi:TPR repeat protein|nr:sel1 repeat family protein [Alphaproteobacteria bacterium]
MRKISALSAILLACALGACAPQATPNRSAGLDSTEHVAQTLKKAEAGDLEAQTELCAFGPNSDALYNPADHGDSWCEKAAEQGSIYAMLDLSGRYDRGLDREVDHAKAFYWLKRATETRPSDDDIHAPEAYGAMAKTYELGLSGQKPDQRASLKWHLKAANAGWSNSYIDLARMYEAGIGTRQDLKAAAKWYIKAAESGNSGAALALALVYIKGHGVPRDLRKAFFWDSVGERLSQKYSNCTGSCPHGVFPYYSGYIPRAELEAIKGQADGWEEGKPHP